MKNPAATETVTGISPGALVRYFREYLSVHSGITLSGQDMDTMALEMARIALPIQEDIQATAHHDDAGGRSEAEIVERTASLIPLAIKHTGMRVDYRGMLRQAREHINSSGSGYAEMLRQLEGHLEELGQRWYGGDLSVVDELLQLYCVETELRKALVNGGAV